jgi:hypothetical protein
VTPELAASRCAAASARAEGEAVNRWSFKSQLVDPGPSLVVPTASSQAHSHHR